jgi:cobalt/nickel transport system permease protein
MLVSCGLFSIVMAVCRGWYALLLGLILSVIWLLVARLPLKKVAVRLLMVNGFIGVLWVIIPFAVKGREVFSFGPFTATHEGIAYALQITIRSNAIILALLSLLATSSMFSLGHAMGKLGFPDKAVQLLLFAYRYIHVIHREYRRLMNAIKVRGFQPKTNLHTYKTYAYLVGMLLVKSYDRAERIRRAMLCRGFKGKYYDLTEYRIGPADLILGAALIFSTIAVVLAEWVLRTH